VAVDLNENKYIGLMIVSEMETRRKRMKAMARRAQVRKEMKR